MSRVKELSERQKRHRRTRVYELSDAIFSMALASNLESGAAMVAIAEALLAYGYGCAHGDVGGTRERIEHIINWLNKRLADMEQPEAAE